MRKDGWLCATALIFMLVAGSAAAAPRAGMGNALVSGGFFHQQGSDSGNFNADLSLGYFLTPGWEAGFRQALNYNFVEDHRDFWLATTTPF